MGGAVDAGDTLRGVLRISGAVEVTHKRSLMAGLFRMKLFPTASLSLVQAAFIYVLLPGLAG
jgi:hypothetical protein